MPASPDLAPISFDYVLFIEWLHKDERPTGKQLHEGLLCQNIATQLRQCSTADEVVDAIKDAIIGLPFRGIPIVQIDSHGGPPTQGRAGVLGKDSANTLGWEDIWTELRKLNVASQFNLIVIAAACYGDSGHWGLVNSIESLENGIQHVLPAPYTVSVGFSGKVSVQSLADALAAFYRSIFAGSSLPLSVNNANEKLDVAAGEELTFVWMGRVEELSRKALEEGEPKESLSTKFKRDFPGISNAELETMMTEVNELAKSVGIEALDRISGKK